MVRDPVAQTLGVEPSMHVRDLALALLVASAAAAPVHANAAPTAVMSWSCVDLSCSFFDNSTDDTGIVAWSWDFGDGEGSMEQHPAHEYAADGVYNVSLTVWDDQMANTTVVEVVEVSTPAYPPFAQFGWHCDAMTCTFVDTSLEGSAPLASWHWDFGDGATSTEQDPVHAFASGGAHTVTLTVTDAEGRQDSGTRTVGVIVLQVSEDKQKGQRVAVLSWSAATGTTVDVHQDGSHLATTQNDGSFEVAGGKGKPTTHAFQVCGMQACSNVVEAAI